ncbi:hypothetical protein EBU94_06425 [bacterium]|nr:hypothetical protein [bacterium]
MFNTKGQEIKTGGTISKSFQPGVVYAHIYAGQVKSSKTGKKALELTLEGPALDNFEGWSVDKNDQDGKKFQGQSARVICTSWTEDFASDNPAKNEIIYKLLFIASELGLRDEADDVTGNTIEEWADRMINLLKNKNIYFFLKGTEEEYNGKVVTKLSLPKYKFASSTEDGLEKFDKNNKYHFKSLQNKPLAGFEPATDDFDM